MPFTMSEIGSPSHAVTPTMTVFSREIAEAIASPVHTPYTVWETVKQNQIVFLTGKAGTGKTHLLRELLALPEVVDTKKIVAAPTGIAAQNLGCGCTTIHLAFSFPSRMLDGHQIWESYAPQTKQILETIELLVIEEISMVRVDVIDTIDHVLRQAKKNSTPFGGVKVILCGDPMQLPPVVGKERKLIIDKYHGVYFFDAPCFKEIAMKTITLRKIWRQSDSFFIDILNRLREGRPSKNDLMALNQKRPSSVDHVHITCTNALADKINSVELEKLSGAESTFIAEIQGRFPESSYPTAKYLRLRPGARVMLLRNSTEYRNGTIGTFLTENEMGEILVQLDRGPVLVKRNDWFEYAYTREENKLRHRTIGSFNQLPAKLAWAVTVHKSQGMTFPKITLNKGTGRFFDHGHLYVACSRCTDLENISVTYPITPNDVVCDRRVLEFMNF